jgi:hypothetical protein
MQIAVPTLYFYFYLKHVLYLYYYMFQILDLGLWNVNTFYFVLQFGILLIHGLHH